MNSAFVSLIFLGFWRELLLPRAARRRVCSSAILFIGGVLHPLDRLAVESFLNGNVGHGCRGRRAVPVLFSGREPDHVAWADFLDATALSLHPADPRRDDQGLTKRMRVPGSPSAGFESDSRTTDAGRRRRGEEWVDADGAGEPVRGSLARWLRSGACDLHCWTLLQCAVKPPSTGRPTPVTKLAPGLHSHSTAAATSSALPSRPIDCWFMISAIASA